jgi:hypothetical protein
MMRGESSCIMVENECTDMEQGLAIKVAFRYQSSCMGKVIRRVHRRLDCPFFAI